MLRSDFGPAKAQKITNFSKHFKADLPTCGLGSMNLVSAHRKMDFDAPFKPADPSANLEYREFRVPRQSDLGGGYVEPFRLSAWTMEPTRTIALTSCRRRRRPDAEVPDRGVAATLHPGRFDNDQTGTTGSELAVSTGLNSEDRRSDGPGAAEGRGFANAGSTPPNGR
jgi:hypothetical protein